jgi:hypothetical protein
MAMKQCPPLIIKKYLTDEQEGMFKGLSSIFKLFDFHFFNYLISHKSVYEIIHAQRKLLILFIIANVIDNLPETLIVGIITWGNSDINIEKTSANNFFVNFFTIGACHRLLGITWIFSF